MNMRTHEHMSTGTQTLAIRTYQIKGGRSHGDESWAAPGQMLKTAEGQSQGHPRFLALST